MSGSSVQVSSLASRTRPVTDNIYFSPQLRMPLDWALSVYLYPMIRRRAALSSAGHGELLALAPHIFARKRGLNFAIFLGCPRPFPHRAWPHE